MSNLINNFGLDFLMETEETAMGVINYIASEGKAIEGYYGIPYVCKSMGKPEFWLKMKKIEDRTLGIEELDTHCVGRYVWDMKHMGIDLDVEGDSKLGRTAMFTKADGEGGMVPIEIINADVLPSFLEGDKFRMQVVALPLDIGYYADEEEYTESCPEDNKGKRWCAALGSMFPVAFLANHSADKEEQLENQYSDRYVSFAAKVSKLYCGNFELCDMKETTYIICIAETDFGEIEFAHTYEQVPEELRNNIKVGSIISGVCVISADVAIDEYKDGIIKDFEHNLSLFRYTIQEGDHERLRRVLAESAVYETYSSDATFIGADEIIAWLKSVREESGEKCFAHFATITETNEEGKHPVGTRCLVLTYNEIDNYEGILFMSVNEDGEITNIEISNDSGYRFKVEFPDRAKTPFDDIELPESVIQPMINRAKFIEIIDEDLSDEEIMNVENYNGYADNAERMYEALINSDYENMDSALENVFGYLFAKAIEKTINEHNVDMNCGFCLTASFSPCDDMEGTIRSTLDPEKHKQLEESMELGAKFYKDLKFFTKMTDADKEAFRESYIQAAVMVQRLGELYAEKLIG